MAKPNLNATSAAKPAFVGIDEVKHIAEKYEPALIMGAARSNADEFARMKVKTVSGVQFKLVKNLFIRKGGTTRKKVVGQKISSIAGFVRERELITGLAWNMFLANEDMYIETPVQINDSAEFHFPETEKAIWALLATYGEDIFANIWKGDASLSEEEGAGNNIFDGWITYINKDIAAGLIGTERGNLVNIANVDSTAFAAPTKEGDSTAFKSFEAFRMKWDARLRTKNVIVYLSTAVALNIRKAYQESNRSLEKANILPNGNFILPDYPKVEFCPIDEWEGTKMIATVPENLIYAVDTENAESFVSVMHGDPTTDHKLISFQVQSVQGCMLLNPLADNFCMNNGSLTINAIQGDYTDTQIYANTNNSTYGNVTVTGDGVSTDDDGNVTAKEGSTVTLTAAATSAGEFSKWNDGVTTAVRQIVASQDVMQYTAIFTAK